MKLVNYHFAKANKTEAKKYYELALQESQTIAEEELMSIISNLYTLYSETMIWLVLNGLMMRLLKSTHTRVTYIRQKPKSGLPKKSN